MKGDPWHTDESGYDLIAGAVVEALAREAAFGGRGSSPAR